MLFVGEVAVGAYNGLFTVPGFITLSLLYILYFNVFDAIVAKYHLSNLGAVLLNFALYSVLITGLFHGELADYVLEPENNLITTLIRLQCSMYPLFAYYWLRRFAPTHRKTNNVRKHVLILLGFMLLVSPTGTIGFGVLLHTISVAPHVVSLFLILASISLWVAFTRQSPKQPSTSRWLRFGSIILGLIALIPNFIMFLTLLIAMLVMGILLLKSPSYRNAAIN